MPDVTLKIRRSDPTAGARALLAGVHGAGGASMTVLEALFWIQEHTDGSLAFRYCCRSSICGSCAMYINGRYRLACQTNLSAPRRRLA